MSAPSRPRRKTHLPPSNLGDMQYDYNSNHEIDSIPSRPRRKSHFTPSNPADMADEELDGPSRPRRKSHFTPSDPADMNDNEQSGPTRPKRKSQFTASNPADMVDDEPNGPSRPRRKSHFVDAKGMGAKRLSMEGKSLLLLASNSAQPSRPRKVIKLPDHLVDRSNRKDIENMFSKVSQMKLKFETACIEYSKFCQEVSSFVSKIKRDNKITAFDEERVDLINTHLSAGVLDIAHVLADPDNLRPDLFHEISRARTKKSNEMFESYQTLEKNREIELKQELENLKREDDRLRKKEEKEYRLKREKEELEKIRKEAGEQKKKREEEERRIQREREEREEKRRQEERERKRLKQEEEEREILRREEELKSIRRKAELERLQYEEELQKRELIAKQQQEERRLMQEREEQLRIQREREREEREMREREERLERLRKEALEEQRLEKIRSDEAEKRRVQLEKEEEKLMKEREERERKDQEIVRKLKEARKLRQEQKLREQREMEQFELEQKERKSHAEKEKKKRRPIISKRKVTGRAPPRSRTNRVTTIEESASQNELDKHRTTTKLSADVTTVPEISTSRSSRSANDRGKKAPPRSGGRTVPKRRRVPPIEVKSEPSGGAAPPARSVRSARTRRTKALYRFKGENEDELDFDEGDDILILRKLEQGWSDGMNLRTRKRGIFPTSYAGE